jgi:hypothetical protein
MVVEATGEHLFLIYPVSGMLKGTLPPTLFIVVDLRTVPMKAARLLLVALCALLPVSRVASAAPVDRTVHAAPVVHVAPVPAPRVPLAPLSLLGFALVGATADAKTKARKVNLSQSYIFDNLTYGPGIGIEVPEGFPELDAAGDVIFPEGSAAARNQARARSFSSPPSSGGVNTGEGAPNDTSTVSGKSVNELEAMTKGDLETLATDLGTTVVRQNEDGDEVDGEPLKADYVRTLGAAKK